MPSARLRSINRRSSSRISSMIIGNQTFECRQVQFQCGLFADPMIKVGCVEFGRKAVCQSSLVEESRGGLSVGVILAKTVRDNER